MTDLQKTLSTLYTGRSRRAARFRLALLGFDTLTIGFFIVATMVEPEPWVWAVDIAFAVVLAADFAARLAIATHRPRFLAQLTSLADLVVIVTLLVAPFIESWAFLRVLRALKLLRSYHVLRDLRSRHPFFRRNEDVIVSCVNLAVFVFFVTALVYVLEKDVNPGIRTYVDALYFTVTTLTTTGFGDITLSGTEGRLLAVVVMVVGVGLFLRLVQTIFRPPKARYTCPDCGLSSHDADASHCKHCGHVIYIEHESP